MKSCRTRRVPAAGPDTPEVRPEVVARARRLIADPGYPSPAVTRAVAGVLARKLSGEAADRVRLLPS